MDTTPLIRARELLFPDSEGLCHKGKFVSLLCDMPAPYVSKPGMLDILTLALRSVALHEGNMLTAMERLDWTRDRLSEDDNSQSRWLSYASMDIEYWHVN